MTVNLMLKYKADAPLILRVQKTLTSRSNVMRPSYRMNARGTYGHVSIVITQLWTVQN